MLVITIPAVDYYDDKAKRFVSAEAFTIKLEHSLASISKWESITLKPFLTDTPKTPEELLTYIQAMSEEEIPPEILKNLSQENVEAINGLINDKKTATWFRESSNRSKSSEIVTSELIYYYMSSYGIPYEAQYWHFNRLLTLIRVFNEKNAPQKKMGRRELADQRRQLNAARQKASGTTG